MISGICRSPLRVRMVRAPADRGHAPLAAEVGTQVQANEALGFVGGRVSQGEASGLRRDRNPFEDVAVAQNQQVDEGIRPASPAAVPGGWTFQSPIRSP
jgi:hypothetical protein